MEIRKSLGEIKKYKGKPTIFINDIPLAPVIYALTDTPGGRWSWEELPQANIRRFYEAGIKIFQLDVFLEQIFDESGKCNLEIPKKQIRGVLDVCPEANIIFRFHVNAPKWWIAKYPEECTVYDKAGWAKDDVLAVPQIIQSDARNCQRFSLASKKWLEYATEKLIKFCKLFSKTEEGNALIGMQLASGIYGEWHYWGFLNWEGDFSAPMVKHFSNWLKLKYKSIEILRKSWNDTQITFESISVPDTYEREKISAGIFRDPEKERKVIDYYNCQHELVADNIIHFCRIVKENWPGKIITGTFYGYFFSVFNRLAAGGHLELDRILNSKYVDYLSGPQVYEPECYLSGEPYRSRSLIFSLSLHNKLWLDEMDQEPERVLTFSNGWIDNYDKYEKTVKENIAQIKRNIMFSHSKGHGLWFYDFGVAGVHTHPEQKSGVNYGNRGYWDNPAYMDTIANMNSIADKTLHKDYKSEADVLLVYDTEIMYHLQSVGKGDPVTAQLIDWLSLHSFYSGVIFDPVHLCDLDKVNISQYKVIVFANTFLLREKDIKMISQKIAKSNRSLVWIYAPGYTDGDKIIPENVSKVTGLNLEPIQYNKIPSIEFSKSIGKISEQSPRGVCNPLFSVKKEKGVHILGYYKHNNKPAFAKKNMRNYTSWFIGLPPNDSNLLRYIYQTGGAHIYNNGKDIVYGGAGILTIHTKNGGLKQVKLKNGRSIDLDLSDEPMTVLLNSKNGKKIK